MVLNEILFTPMKSHQGCADLGSEKCHEQSFRLLASGPRNQGA
jgi:hypothetical protein